MKSYDKDQPLYSDNHLLIIDKPAGIPTQTEGSVQTGIDHFAKEWVKQEMQKKGNVFLEPIHRLDKPVSGLVIFARTSKALSRMQEMMRAREIEKVYYTLVEGTLPQKKGNLEHYLVHDEYRARVVSSSTPDAKQAFLEYTVLESRESLCLVEVKLHTGRYHQIRAQFSAIGCPIVGDRKYGSQRFFREEAIALHHGKVSFIHPVKKEPIEVVRLPAF